MIPPWSNRKTFEEAVTQPKAEATSRAPYTQPQPNTPLKGRAIFFDGNDNFSQDSFIEVLIGEDSMAQWVRDTIEKLMETKTGSWLVESLSELLFDRNTGKYNTKIHLMFVGEARSGVDEECGHINRSTDVSEYWVTLKRYVWTGEPLVMAQPGASGFVRCGAKYPPAAQNPKWEMNLCFVDDAVAMGTECTYHELTHIWFIKGGARRERIKRGLLEMHVDWPTGHADYNKGEFEEDFHYMLKKMNDELNRPYKAALDAYNKLFNHP